MVRKFLLTLFFLASTNVFSETVNTIETTNAYGGKTIEVINDIDSIETERWSKIIEFYDTSNSLVKRVITPSPTIINERGIREQINYYKDGVIEKYEMKFTDEFIKLHDFDKLVELVYNGNLTITTIWYKNDNVIDAINYPQDMHLFEFYNIKFIETEFLGMHTPKKSRKNDEMITSGKYTRIRSIVKFDTKLVDLDKQDIAIITLLTGQFGQPDFKNYYKKKVRVSYEGNYYWLFVQTIWEEHIKGQDVTVKYYPVSYNEKLYLLCVGFFEIDKQA